MSLQTNTELPVSLPRRKNVSVCVTHKPNPLYHKGLWTGPIRQGALSKFIPKHLNLLPVNDPFLVQNSQQVLEVLCEQHFCGESFYACSVDVEDLFYSLPQKAIMCAVRECIDDFGPVAFQNSAGVSVDIFFRMAEFLSFFNFGALW